MSNRKLDIEEVVEKLDISATMYENAVEKYKAIANFLKEQEIQADFYPQGSFRLGTVVRPLRNGKDADYDLDVICELKEDKRKTTPMYTKKCIGKALESNKTYSEKLLPEYDRCWTLQYALVDGEVGFELDIVPCVHQDDSSIRELISQSVPSGLANCAVSITERVSKDQYNWQASNSKGYGLWFDSINGRFLESNRNERRNNIYNRNRHIYSSVEAVPSALERSSLQRIIQILKRHRDIFYTNARSWEKRPISAIITTLAAKIAHHSPSESLVYDLLKYVAEDLNTYAKLLSGGHPGYYDNFEERTYIKKESQAWKILNPVDPNDNYADSWDYATATMFFKWIEAVKTDFINPFDKDDDQYYSGLKNGLGVYAVESAIPNLKIQYKTVNIGGTKPWRRY